METVLDIDNFYKYPQDKNTGKLTSKRIYFFGYIMKVYSKDTNLDKVTVGKSSSGDQTKSFSHKWMATQMTRRVRYKVKELKQGDFFGHDEIIAGCKRTTTIYSKHEAKVPKYIFLPFQCYSLKISC